MTNGFLTVEDYINAYEPQYADEIEIQAAELEPWIEDKETQLDITPVFNDAGQRVYQKGLVAWAFGEVRIAGRGTFLRLASRAAAIGGFTRA